jgi:putative methionine-R-sulfoxide reductase with GAF domain
VRVNTDVREGRSRREARIAGLREFQTPSLEAVERRRAQLWGRTAAGLVLVLGVVLWLSRWPADAVVEVSAGTLQTVVIAAAAAFFAVAAWQEVFLGRLTRQLSDERVLAASLTNRLHQVELLLDAGREMTSVLDLPVVVDVILRSATELLEADGGSVLLLEGDELVAVGVRGRNQAKGTRLRLGEGVAGHVALRLEPVLIEGQVDPREFPGMVEREPYVDSAMSVPLLHGGLLLGVLNVNAPLGSGFTPHDLRALAVFAEQAAAAIANARRYEAERAQVAELRRIGEGGGR